MGRGQMSARLRGRPASFPGVETPPPLRRERKAPGAENTAAQGEGESGEAEVKAREEGGSA